MLNQTRIRITGLFERAFAFRTFTKFPDENPSLNEPVLEYKPGSEEREKLQEALTKWSQDTTKIPVVIGDTHYETNESVYQLMPHNHKHKLAKVFWANEELLKTAIDTALDAQKKWAEEPWEKRTEIFQKAAKLMTTKYRFDLNATTMLGQSKNAFQAEIDSGCELSDFFNYNVYFLKEILKYKPVSVTPSVTLNTANFRGLEGFVAAISPFNFTAIGGNLAYAPALMGNAVLWKPSDTAALSNYLIFKILREAGMPPGVVNFVPTLGQRFGDLITGNPSLAAINFTGSAKTFEILWKSVGSNIGRYKSYPRLIGECGGKNFHYIHSSADILNASRHTIRSAFEYQGQKCSACSRIYVPKSKWPQMQKYLCKIRDEIKVGDPADFKTFMGAVIDEVAYKRVLSYIEFAKGDPSSRIVAGGDSSDTTGYFIQPTIIETSDPLSKLLTEEIFGPVLTVYVYDDSKWLETLDIVNSSTPYALTGAIFANDEGFIHMAKKYLRNAAGNFYVNDKSTGAVVAQQPFGGARKSGTNDKAGGPHYLLRFTSMQIVKETYFPVMDWKYPHME